MSKWTVDLVLFLIVGLALGAPVGQSRAKGWIRLVGFVVILAAASIFGLGAAGFVLKFAAVAVAIGTVVLLILHALRSLAPRK